MNPETNNLYVLLQIWILVCISLYFAKKLVLRKKGLLGKINMIKAKKTFNLKFYGLNIVNSFFSRQKHHN